MALNKTQLTSASPAAYIAAIVDEGRRQDCATLARLMAEVSKQPARMWGPSIVGFGTHRYALAGGKEGEICAIGFSSRTADITIYGAGGECADAGLLAKLGRHDRGKGCVYVRRMADVDHEVLRRLLTDAVKRRMA